jgi:hypothetical protein
MVHFYPQSFLVFLLFFLRTLFLLVLKNSLFFEKNAGDVPGTTSYQDQGPGQLRPLLSPSAQHPQP